ncbi:MAG: RNA polymerase sigma factor [Hormoscilla sp.]
MQSSGKLADCLPEQLVERCLQGDTQACDRLLLDQQHRQTVERLARKYTQGTSISWEDAAQEAQEKVLKATRSGKFRNDGVEKFYRWAAAVAQNALIDRLRKENRRQGPWYWHSLDEQIPGTNMMRWEIIADDFNLWDVVERADLVSKVPEILETLDQRYPKKRYLQLSQGLVAERTQSQLAAELGVGQSEVSKRRKELLLLIGKELGLLSVERVETELRSIRQGKGRGRTRSDSQW